MNLFSCKMIRPVFFASLLSVISGACVFEGAGHKPTAGPKSALPEPAGKRGGRRRLAQARLYYLREKNYPEALKIFQELTARFPERIPLWIEQAQAAFLAGERGLVLKSLTAAEKLQPGSEERHQMALLYQDLGQYAPASEYFQEIVRKHPRNAVYLKDRGICDYYLGKISQAAQSLRQAMALDPKLLSARLTLASIYSEKRCYRQALEVYDSTPPALPGKNNDQDEETLQSLIKSARREAFQLSQTVAPADCNF